MSIAREYLKYRTSYCFGRYTVSRERREIVCVLPTGTFFL